MATPASPTVETAIPTAVEAAVPAPVKKVETALPGTTVTEVPKLETLNRLEDIKNTLKDSAKILFQMHDGPGVLMVAQAAACGETPLGLEYQYNILDSLRHMSAGTLEDQMPMMVLHGKLGKLNFPEKPPAGEMVKFVSAHQGEFPPGYEPGRIALMLNAGRTSVLGLASELRGNEQFAKLRQPFMEALTGRGSHVMENPAAMLSNVGFNNKDIATVLQYGGKRPGMTGSLKFGLAMLGVQFLLSNFQEVQQQNQAAAHSAH